MKGSKAVIVAIVVVVLGFLIIYSQTGIPEGAKEMHAAAGGYGGGGIEGVPTPNPVFVGLPGDEGVIPPGANPHLLVQTGDVEKNKGKWVIVDCRDRNLYDQGHIPSAIHLGQSCNDFFRGDIELKDGRVVKNVGMKTVAELEEKVGRAGLSHDMTIVFYDGEMGNPAAGRNYGILAGFQFVPFWFMEYLGHPDVRVLDGGILAWKAEERPLSTTANSLPPTTFKARVVAERLATTEEMIRIAEKEIKDVQIVDVRTPGEISGEVPAPPGHFLTDKIKNAGRIPDTDLAAPHFFQFADMETFKLKPIWQLQRIYASLNKDKRTVAICVLGNRSSMSYFVLRMLGFRNPANYHDSWFAYGNLEGVPMVTLPGGEK